MGSLGVDNSFLSLTSNKGGKVGSSWGNYKPSVSTTSYQNSEKMGLVERLDKINCELTPVCDANFQVMA